jgi:hypothetical protein
MLCYSSLPSKLSINPSAWYLRDFHIKIQLYIPNLSPVSTQALYLIQLKFSSEGFLITVMKN